MLRFGFLVLWILTVASQAFGGIVCTPGSEIAVTYETQGRQVTDRRLFRDDSSAAQTAMGQYKSYVASLAANKILAVSRNPLITCSTMAPRMAMASRSASATPELTLVDTNVKTACRTTYPSQRTVMVECDDGSVAVYNKDQDSVYVRPAAQELYDDMYRQTQAMNALMNQADLLTRPDWKKGSQSVTVTGKDFDMVLDAVTAEAQGTKFPKPEDLTKNFKNFKLTPLNDAMEKTFRQQQERLQRFARVNNSFTMSPGQIQSYFERFAQGLERLDDLSQRNSPASDTEANAMVGDFINDLVVTGQGGPFSAERRAAAKAVLDSFAPNGLIPRPQNEELNSFLSRLKLKTSLDDSDLSKREYAAELRGVINKISGMAIRGGVELLKNSLIALGWAGNADVAFSGLTEGDEVKGLRLLDRLNAFFDYGQPKKPAMPGVSLEESAIFHLGQLGNTFENSEIVKAVKELFNEAGLLDDPYYRFHAVLSINQALKAATQDRFGDFSVQIENAYAALDCYRGYGTGLALSVWNTLEGVYKIGAHPLNSTYALAMSMVNYEDTWSGLKGIIHEKYSTVKNCDQDKFACGQVVGLLAGDITQFVVGIAEIKAPLTLAAVHEGAETAAEIVIDATSDVARRASSLGIDDGQKLESLLESAGKIEPCDVAACGIATQVNNAQEALKSVEKLGTEAAPAGQAITDLMRFRKRTLELGMEPKRKPDLAEGIGGARFEIATGRTLTRSADPSYDFIDSVLGKIDLKGPLRTKAGLPMSITGDRLDGLIASVVHEANVSSAANKIVVDTFGMTSDQIKYMETALKAKVFDLKKIIYLK
ncbi:MAG TPA: hypothetical protein VE954_05880 [Oligoflexus sp.]|uniref:hypothetical protein n=1 Tax=Oligoflexus sp. TaxID=1971216 RepID=UPI002D55D7CF|nr:hypothetical protein [Oligoflexus sp.]HYX32622.1 hypothetical protein [Oligoflexus sp.]